MTTVVGNLSVPITADLGPITADLEKLKKQLASFDAQMLAGVGKATNGATQQTNQLRDALGRFAKQTDTATNSTGQARDALGRFVKVGGDTNEMLGENARRTMSFTSALGPLAAALAGVFSVRALIQFTDTWTDLTSRVNLAAGSIEKGAAVMDRLSIIADRTYSSLDLTAETYVRNAQTLRDLGKSTQETLDYTEALNNALVISGAKADRAEQVQNALGKALAAGALRGEELNTVITTGGAVAEALAEELGTTVSGLRKLGQEGKITGDIVYNSLTKRFEYFQQKAEEMPATISDGFQRISNALLRTIGVFDQLNQVSGTVASSFIFIAENMQRLVTYVGTATVAWGAYRVAVIAVNAGLFTTAGALTLVQAALRRLIASTGIGILIVAVGELVNIILDARSATDSWSEAWGRMGTFFQQVSYAMQDAFRGVAIGMQGIWAGFIAYFLRSTSEALGVFGILYDVTDQIKAAETESRQSLTGAAIRFEDASETLTNAYAKLREGIGEIDLSGDGGPNRVVADPGKEKKTKAQRDAERLAEAYKNLVRDSQAFIAQQEIERQAIGMTELEAAKLRATFDLLNQAQRAGITLTAAQTEELTNLAHQMAEAEYATNKLREQYDFAKDTFKGFFTDLKTELQNGASIWEAFGTAASNALQKIADKALDMALNGLFDLIFGSLFGGGGGFLNSGGGFRSIIGYANGTSFAPGGVALVGERGPELVNLPAGAQVYSNNRVIAPSQASFGGGVGGVAQSVAIEVFVKDDGKIGAIARQEAGSLVEVAIHDYDTNQLPSSVERVSRHPRIR